MYRRREAAEVHGWITAPQTSTLNVLWSVVDIEHEPLIEFARHTKIDRQFCRDRVV
jgi:hypothetical protein